MNFDLFSTAVNYRVMFIHLDWDLPASGDGQGTK